mgnify:CR=1 FL=1
MLLRNLNLVNAPNQSSPRSRLYFVASLLATALGYRNAATDMEDLKCAYEIAREEQIRRNKEFLKSLNLVNPIEKKTSRTPGTKRKKNVHEKHDHDDSKKRKTTRRLGGGEKRIVRQSLRLSGKDPDGKTAKLDEKVKLQQKIEEDRLLKYEKLVKLHKSKGNAKLPKTASYAHTLDRVLSMSTKALESRMNKIERANGKYAIVKMRMFAEVLLLEGYEDLAKKCEASLLRIQTANS